MGFGKAEEVFELALADGFRGGVEEELTLAQAEDAREVGAGEVDVVEADQEGQVVLGGEGLEEFQEGSRAGWVDGGEGFVGEEEAWGLVEGASDGDALLFAAGEGVGASVEVVLDAEAFEELVDALQSGARWEECGRERGQKALAAYAAGEDVAVDG
jgi:hypothetical protein